ncbi:MAG: hypothetical protein IJU54_01925 [Alphaproteobacteria bacterium]|nr:hypothetical protein [Alphaproteobacteria bacterium]
MIKKVCKILGLGMILMYQTSSASEKTIEHFLMDANCNKSMFIEVRGDSIRPSDNFVLNEPNDRSIKFRRRLFK